jgi:hypothetical protein
MKALFFSMFIAAKRSAEADRLSLTGRLIYSSRNYGIGAKMFPGRNNRLSSRKRVLQPENTFIAMP